MRNILKINAEFWTEDRSLTALLVYLLIDVFFLLPFMHTEAGEIINAVFFSLILISGVFAVASETHFRIMIILLAMTTFVIQWLHLVDGSVYFQIANVISSIVFLSTLTFVVILHIFKGGQVSFHRIQGAIAVYILVGLIWANAYHIIYLFYQNAFIFPDFQKAGEPFYNRFMYFSYVTLTTLGYGDIIPINAAAKSLVMVEGLTGQLFPAIMITRLVSLEIESRKNRMV